MIEAMTQSHDAELRRGRINGIVRSVGMDLHVRGCRGRRRVIEEDRVVVARARVGVAQMMSLTAV